MPEETPSTQSASEEEKPEEKEPEEKETENEEISEESPSDFLSPMALIMFMTAGFIDLLGLFLLLFGLDDLGILDITGLIFVGGLMFLHSGTVTTAKSVRQKKPKIFKKLILSFLGELIPGFGSIAPCWTIAVYLHLKGK